MNEFKELYAEFAHLKRPMLEELVKIILRLRWQRALSSTAHKHLTPQKTKIKGIIALLSEAASKDFFDFPHPLLTLLEHSIRSQKSPPIKTIIETALLVSLHGVEGCWEVILEDSEDLIFHTHTLDQVTRVEATMCASGISLEIIQKRMKTNFEINLKANIAPTSGMVDCTSKLPTVKCKSKELILIPYKNLPITFTQHAPGMTAPTRENIYQRKTYVENALDAIDKASPNLKTWISSGVKFIACFESIDRAHVTSSSFKSHLGLIVITGDKNHLLTGELLIHEASHQIFNIARSISPIVDSQDDSLYYSALTRSQRPIDKVLMAYHAAANILMYYQYCIDAGLDSEGYCNNRLKTLSAGLDEMYKSLNISSTLSLLGKYIFKTLQEEIRSNLLNR